MHEALFFVPGPHGVSSEAGQEQRLQGRRKTVQTGRIKIRPCSFRVRFPFSSKITDRKPDCLGQKAPGQAAGDSYPGFHFLNPFFHLKNTDKKPNPKAYDRQKHPIPYYFPSFLQNEGPKMRKIPPESLLLRKRKIQHLWQLSPLWNPASCGSSSTRSRGCRAPRNGRRRSSTF